MIPITGVSSRLQAFCGSAVTTDVKFTVGYLNMLSQTGITTVGQRGTQIRTVSDGVTDVQIAPYPGQNAISSTITTGQNNYTQNIFYVKAYNSNASAVTVTIQIEDGADDIQIKATLGTLETLYYEDGRGWYSTDSNGAVKTSLGPTGQFTTLTVSGNTTLGDAAADSLTVNAGVYSAPNQPAFLAYNSATDTNVTGNGANADYICDTEIFDQGANFNNATGVFTAPVTGRYIFIAKALVQEITAAMTQRNIEIVTSNRTYAQQDIYAIGAGNASEQLIHVTFADMDAADTAFPRVRLANGAGDTADVFGAATGMYTMFAGRQTN